MLPIPIIYEWLAAWRTAVERRSLNVGEGIPAQCVHDAPPGH